MANDPNMPPRALLVDISLSEAEQSSSSLVTTLDASLNSTAIEMPRAPPPSLNTSLNTSYNTTLNTSHNTTLNTTNGSSSGYGSPFLVSPRVFQLYNLAREASTTPVPDDWNKKLADAVKALPDDVSVHDFIQLVASLSPDRARTLIQVLEEEVSVMEDVVDKMARDRIKRLQREHEAELKKLKEEYNTVRMAAIEANNQLKTLYPDFEWEYYHDDPNYLQDLVCCQERRVEAGTPVQQGSAPAEQGPSTSGSSEPEEADRSAEEEDIEEIIREKLRQKKLFMEDIDNLRHQREILQRRLDEGCELDLEEELEKARAENKMLRDHYNYLKRATSDNPDEESQ